jgi:hypothetical protein
MTTLPKRAFALWLEEQRGGALHDELTDALSTVVAAVGEHRKVGSLTLTIKLKPNGPGEVIVSDDVRTNVPHGKRAASMFADNGGSLWRAHPDQPELPLETGS